jgi:hypothetical protein
MYGQLIGEDEAGGLPSRFIGLFGLEIWRFGGQDPASQRLYMEYADTAAAFYQSSPIYNYAYEHGIYRSGYRYYGRSLGHSLDGDGRMLSLGVMGVAASGNFWEVLVRKIAPNRDAIPAQTFLEFGLRYTLDNGPSRYIIEAGLDRGGGTQDFTKGRVALQWRRLF